ncbi:MAG: hypothetical protein LBB48_01580 [Treponema sp.]|jgi:hypothetical protein|nr:hypothetical protein [Treponema sp.]
MRDSITSNEAEFSAFARRFAAAAKKYAVPPGIPRAAVVRLKAALTAYETAYAGRLDRVGRKEKRETLEPGAHKAKNAYAAAVPPGAVTDGIRTDSGLPLAGSPRADAPAPAETAAFTLEHGGRPRVAARHPAKLPRYNGAAAFCKAAGAEPVKFEQLDSSKLLTRMIETITFKDADLGKTLHIALCRENGKGRLAPRLRYRGR